MDTWTQDVPGYYVWGAPGKAVAVHLHLDVIDRLLPEVMRGFGAVPKRGAEVGGVLIGTIEPGDPAVVRIEDFELVDCSYKRGPSYLFSEEDAEAFEEACRRWGSADPAYAVGYFRSHTRDGLSLGQEDVALLDEYFQEPASVALLIKPFATKPSVAGFFFREDGVFSEATALEFPFRRRELTGEAPPPRRPLTERSAERGMTRLRRREPPVREEFEEGVQGPGREEEQPDGEYAGTAPARTGMMRWMWMIPLSFVFLLLGVGLGFQAATSMGRNAGNGEQDFELALAVTRMGNNLSVKWNPDSAAVKLAQRGVLEIEDGGASKSVDLDPQYLQTGAITYNNNSGTVHFRLVVYLNSRSSVVESLDWRQ